MLNNSNFTRDTKNAKHHIAIQYCPKIYSICVIYVSRKGMALKDESVAQSGTYVSSLIIAQQSLVKTKGEICFMCGQVDG